MFRRTAAVARQPVCGGAGRQGHCRQEPAKHVQELQCGLAARRDVSATYLVAPENAVLSVAHFRTSPADRGISLPRSIPVALCRFHSRARQQH